jgi:hypothetical protein
VSEKKVIAVIGATGAQGGGLADAILAEPDGAFAVRAVTRRAGSDRARVLAGRGAEVVEADLGAEAGLRRAFDGAYGDFSAVPPARRNLIYRHFLHPDPAGRHYGMTGAEEFGRLAAGQLRAAAGRYPNDPHIRTMVSTLRRQSPEFAEMRDDHHVQTGFHHHKTMQHPVVGPLRLNCDTLAVPMRDQYIVCFTAERGSPSHQALRLLSVVGTQDMAVGPDEG